MEEELQARIHKLQLIEESLHGYLAQKQQLQSQQMELESAKDALEGATASYKIIGNIMVEKPADELRKDIAERMERLTLRITSLEKQEQRLKEQAEGLQQGIMASMKKDGESNGKL
jgi:prefoldin beta subunit